LREACEAFFKGKDVDDVIARCLLELELDSLFMEEKRLRRLSDKILSNNAYLREYARRLMIGGFEDGATKYRSPLTASPNAAVIIQTFEGIFNHRQRVGERMAEIARQLYPGEYGLNSLPSSDQNARFKPVNNVRELKGDEL
jgi:hypothetical protein